MPYDNAGQTIILDAGCRDALCSRLRPLVAAGALPNYPAELAFGGFEDYCISHRERIDGALQFIQQRVQPAAGEVLHSVWPELYHSARRVGGGETSFILVRGLPHEDLLPPTPFRGSASMHRVPAPQQAFMMDLVLLGLLDAASCVAAGFAQSNIDPLDERGESPPLLLHADRGADVTAIGALRGKPGTFTHLMSWSAVVEQLNAPDPLRLLSEQRYVARDGSECFAVLTHSSRGECLLSEHIISGHIELNDVSAQQGDVEAQGALAALRLALDWHNAHLEAGADAHDDPSLCVGHWRYELHAGDALIFSNRHVLHGRSRGVGDTGATNRWVRLAFGKRKSGTPMNFEQLQRSGTIPEQIAWWRERLNITKAP